MADHVTSLSASGLVHTGVGQVMAISITASSGAPQVTLYDNTAGSGTKLYDALVSYIGGVHLFFGEKFALTFLTGLYANLAANAVINIWWRDM